MLLSWVFWGVIVLVAIALLSRIPGIDLALKPIGILLQDLVKWIGATGGGYLVYLVKTFVRFHLVIIDHLFHAEDHYDVELRVRNEGDT